MVGNKPIKKNLGKRERDVCVSSGSNPQIDKFKMVTEPHNKNKTRVISLGGSLIVPREIDISFLKKFRELIGSYNSKFYIVCGGGETARKYIKVAEKFTKQSDYVGIKATWLNGELVKSLFKNVHSEILIKPKLVKEKVVICGGNLPGRSSDYEAVLFSHKVGNKELINLTNIDQVYDKDPRKYKTAKPLKDLTWNEYRKICGNKWVPGMNLPFDPIAAKYAQKNKIKVVILNGKKIKNLKNYLDGKSFKGTIIHS